MPRQKAPQKPLSQALKPRLSLIKARKLAGFTQVELAEKIGCTPWQIKRVEGGHRNPRLPAMVRWVDALGPYGTLELFRPAPGSSTDQAA